MDTKQHIDAELYGPMIWFLVCYL